MLKMASIPRVMDRTSRRCQHALPRLLGPKVVEQGQPLVTTGPEHHTCPADAGTHGEEVVVANTDTPSGLAVPASGDGLVTDVLDALSAPGAMGEVLQRCAHAVVSRLDAAFARIWVLNEAARPHLTNDVRSDPRIGNPAWAQCEGMVAFAGYPLAAGRRVVGVVGIFAPPRARGAPRPWWGRHCPARDDGAV